MSNLIKKPNKNKSKFDIDIFFGEKDIPLRNFEKEIFSKLKEIGVSFKQAEIFLDLVKQDLKDHKLK